MKWSSRSKRNSVAQQEKHQKSNESLSEKPGYSRNSSTATISRQSTSEIYKNERAGRSNASISSSSTKPNSSTSSGLSSSDSQASISTSKYDTPSASIIRTQSVATLTDKNDDASITQSLNSMKLNSMSRPFNSDNYDSTLIKTGWINKGSNLSNWNNTNPDTWRIYKAELRGPTLSLYKLPGDLNIKSFDPQLGQSEQTTAGSSSVRHKRLSSSASRANLRADLRSQDIRSPTTPTHSTHNSINSSTTISNTSGEQESSSSRNYRVKLKYVSEVYPHPELQLNNMNSIVSGTLESICHTILFNTLEDDKLSYNLLLILPLLGDIKAALKYFIEYALTMTSQKVYKNSSTTKVPISQNTDYAITQRMGLVINTIAETFPGMLLDDDIYDLCFNLISGIHQHDEHLADGLKKSLPKKAEQMKKLTFFKTAKFDPNGSSAFTNVDSFLKLDSNLIATQINLIDLKFNKHWNPKNDPSLLYELENVSYPRLNPLISNSTSNIHYLGRLLVNHLFGDHDSAKLESRRAQILSKWIEIGCIFDKIGDMVSWLAIATTICSIPILRLRKSWSIVDEEHLKIISTEWAPVVFELDRRTMISEASHRSSYHVIAPQGLGVTYSKSDVVPYFGDLTVKYVENSTLKQCEKRVQRVKVSFSRWDEYLDQVEEDASVFADSKKEENQDLIKQLYNLLANHVQLSPLTQESVMELSLSIEPDAIGKYHKGYDTRTPLITGSYLPTLFSEIMPSYKLFDQNVLIGASGFPTNKKKDSPQSTRDFKQVTGVDDIDAQSFSVNSKLPSSKSQHTFLKSVRDIFNVGSDVFHMDDDLIFKSLSNEDELKSSRPASVVLENPSSKRLSQMSNSNRLSLGAAPGDNSLDAEDDVFAVLDNANLLNSLIKPLNVVLKAGTFDRMVDILVLTSNVFSKKIDQKDIESYLAKTNLLDNQFLKLKMNNGVYTSTFFSTYRSFSTTTVLLESLTRRFTGSKSAALSISRFNSDSYTESSFPDWDSPVSNDNPDLSWKFVGNIQIGILEALSILVTDHYSDFTDNLQNKTLFVDLLKTLDDEIVVEWKEVLLRFEDSLEIKSELTEIYGILSSLYKKIRKNYIKKCYRPYDLFPKYLPDVDQKYDIDLESLQLPQDFREAELFVNRLDLFVKDLFDNTIIADWIYVFQILEIQSSKSLTSLFKYKWPATQKEEQITILNVFSWLKNLYGDTIEDKILKKFPPPVKLLFEVHLNLEKYFKLQISDVSISRDIRTARMVSILQILTISRLRMNSADLFSSNGKDSVSPHVPSFIESAISQAIVSPESRAYTYSWMYAASALKDEPVDSVDQLLDLLPKLDADDLTENLKGGLTPCIGWFVEILLEISNFVPNMSIENSKLINFDKRRFTYNCITNILDMNSTTVNSHNIQEDSRDIKAEFDLLFKLTQYKEPDFKTIKEISEKENREFPKYDSKTKLFGPLIENELSKIERDSKKKEILENQERDIKRTQLLSQARASLNLNRDMSSLSDLQHSQSSESLSRKNRQNPSPSKVSGVSKRLGGLFKSVRPFSINVGSNWSSPDKIIHPDDLPDINNINLSGKHSKPYQQTKLFNYKPLFVHSNIEGFFKVVSEVGGEEISFQATSNAEAQSWISALNLSKRYTYLSKDSKGLTSSKVFGVPISDLCEREGTLVPTIVERLLQEIEVRGLDETGLYRIPGSVGSINLLKTAFDEGGDFTLEDDRWFEVNTLAGCFKSYLRELPETLFTADLLPEFVQATKEGDLLENIRVLVRQLPIHNYHLLKRLFEHLNKVIQHAEKNRMDAVNLAIVFSMSFLNNDSLGMGMGSDLGALQNILQHLIKNPEAVFSKQFEEDSITVSSPTRTS